MSESDDPDGIKEAKIERTVVEKWVKQLSEKGIIGLREDGSMIIGFASPLNREVDTEPIDQLSIYWDQDNRPPLLSIRKVDEKLKLIISIDSNHIPEKIRSIQDRSETWITRFRYLAWTVVIISSLSFMLQVLYGVQIPDYTTIPRFVIFMTSVILYGLVGRIYLHGIAKGTPISVYGCSDCGEVITKRQAIDSGGFLSCADCGEDMVPLMEGTPSSLSTQSKKFEQMIHEILKDLNKS